MQDVSIKVHPKRLRNILTNLNWLLYSILVFFGLRQKRKYWGIVYDSVTKQPLDPVIVELAYKGGRSQSSITDLNGRYGFLAESGEFKIFARKANYKFPSEFAKGQNDGIYDNLYHGETFVLSGDSEVVAPNIPMDPLQADWNQEAKAKIVPYRPYWSRLFKAMVEILFWAFFVLVAFNFAVEFPKIHLWVAMAFGIYLMLFLLLAIIPQPKLWGKLSFHVRKDTSVLNINLFLENLKVPGLFLGKVKISENAKFLLLAQPGAYLLHVQLLDHQNQVLGEGSTRVRVHKRGLLNSNYSVTIR